MDSIPNNPDFTMLIGLDSKGDIYIDMLSDFPARKATDIAELIFLLTSGELNGDILNCLRNHEKEMIKSKEQDHRGVTTIIKVLKKLTTHYDESPLIDALQILGGGEMK